MSSMPPAGGFRRRVSRLGLLLGLAIVGLALLPAAAPAQPASAVAPAADDAADSAPVVIDGRTLFELRGARAYPAARRAADVEARIRVLAADRTFDPATLQVAQGEHDSTLVARQQRVVIVVDADAELEGLDRTTMTRVVVESIRDAISAYRAARTRDALLSAAWRGAAATLVAIVALWVLVRIARRVRALFVKPIAEEGPPDAARALERIRRERLRLLLGGAVRFAFGLAFAVIGFLYLRYLLGLLPWTRGAASQLDGWVLAPLGVIGNGSVRELPNLIFLAVLFFVVRWLLRFLHGLFNAVGRGELEIQGFDREWADSTYKLLRLVIVLFAVVVGYPYIPRSSSEAFKGISLFAGLVFSLGSSSFVGNMIAGYAITYRRTFRIGDRVQIGGVIGDVVAVRQQVTDLRTPKNEMVSIPNATVLNGELTNYSALARGPGLILHASVGIGYGVPWRQVEAMLLEAARRTPGLMQEPAPFVLQTDLGQINVTYVINVYTDRPAAMARTYTELRRNILDVFNEHAVQIMTPAYEGDPEEPKLVPRDRWFLPPAIRP